MDQADYPFGQVNLQNSDCDYNINLIGLKVRFWKF